MQGGLVMAKSGKLEVGGNILQTLGPIGLPSTTVTKLARKAIEFGEKKTQNKGCYAVHRHHYHHI